MRDRDLKGWGIAADYADLDDFRQNFCGNDGLISIMGERLPIDMLFRRGEGRTLFVFFNAAIGEDRKFSMPYFSWLNISEVCMGSRLFVSDPCMLLSDALRVSWYAGSDGFPAQQILREVFDIILAHCGNRIVFIGSSGGGYPAVYYSHVFDHAVAVVNAPALTLSRHHYHAAVAEYARYCFNAELTADFFSAEAAQVESDLINFLDGKPKNPIVILQNVDDAPYIDAHVAPFLESAGLKWSGKPIFSGNIHVIAGDWGTGHCMPPDEVVVSVLRAIDNYPADDFRAFSQAALPVIVTHVEVVEANGGYAATCHATDQDCQFAFYLLSESERLDMKWYTDCNQYAVKRDLPAGVYRIHGFARRNSDGNVGALLSAPFEVRSTKPAQI